MSYFFFANKYFTKKNLAVSEWVRKIIQPLHNKNHATSKKKWGNEWVSENHATSPHTKHATYQQNTTSPQKKVCNLFTKKKLCNYQKNHTTSPPKKSCNLKKIMQPQKTAQPLHKKFMQPFLTKINATSSPKKSCNLTTQKNHATSKKSHNLFTKNYVASKKVTHPCEWVRKSCNLSTQKHHKISPPKNHATSQQQNNHASSLQKNCTISPKKIMQPLNKTSEELQNAALRTSHWLSSVSNCSFQKYWERRKNRGFKIFLWRGCIIVFTTATFVTAVTTAFFFKFTFSVLLKQAIWHIWQPIWCSQGSLLWFLRCL